MCTVFTRLSLLYTDYKETNHPEDDPRLTGEPDSTLLNKNEAYEMAYFINRYMQNHRYGLESTGWRIEKFIRKSPEKHQSHAFWTNKLDSDFELI